MSRTKFTASDYARVMKQLEENEELNARLDQIMSGFWAQPVTPPEPKKERGDFITGLQHGVKSIEGTFQGAKGLAGATFGSDSMRDQGLKAYLETMESIKAEQRPQYTYEGVETFGDAVDFAQYWLGQGLANIGLGLGLGGIGAALARRGGKELIERGVQKYIADKVAAGVPESAAREAAEKAVRPALVKELNQRTQRGFVAGIAPQAFVQELGATYGKAGEHALEQGKTLDEIDLGRVYAGGLAAGGAEFLADILGAGLLKIGPGKQAFDLLNKSSTPTRVLSKGAIGGAIEGTTEMGQTGLEEWGAGIPNPNFTDPTSFFAGAVPGTAIGMVGGLRKPTPPESPTPSTEEALSQAMQQYGAEQQRLLQEQQRLVQEQQAQAEAEQAAKLQEALRLQYSTQFPRDQFIKRRQDELTAEALATDDAKSAYTEWRIKNTYAPDTPENREKFIKEFSKQFKTKDVTEQLNQEYVQALDEFIAQKEAEKAAEAARARSLPVPVSGLQIQSSPRTDFVVTPTGVAVPRGRVGDMREIGVRKVGQQYLEPPMQAPVAEEKDDQAFSESDTRGTVDIDTRVNAIAAEYEIPQTAEGRPEVKAIDSIRQLLAALDVGAITDSQFHELMLRVKEHPRGDIKVPLDRAIYETSQRENTHVRAKLGRTEVLVPISEFDNQTKEEFLNILKTPPTQRGLVNLKKFSPAQQKLLRALSENPKLTFEDLNVKYIPTPEIRIRVNEGYVTVPHEELRARWAKMTPEQFTILSALAGQDIRTGEPIARALTVQQIARVLGTSREYVYKAIGELGLSTEWKSNEYSEVEEQLAKAEKEAYEKIEALRRTTTARPVVIPVDFTKVEELEAKLARMRLDPKHYQNINLNDVLARLDAAELPPAPYSSAQRAWQRANADDTDETATDEAGSAWADGYHVVTHPDSSAAGTGDTPAPVNLEAAKNRVKKALDKVKAHKVAREAELRSAQSRINNLYAKLDGLPKNAPEYKETRQALAALKKRERRISKILANQQKLIDRLEEELRNLEVYDPKALKKELIDTIKANQVGENAQAIAELQKQLNAETTLASTPAEEASDAAVQEYEATEEELNVALQEEAQEENANAGDVAFAVTMWEKYAGERAPKWEYLPASDRRLIVRVANKFGETKNASADYESFKKSLRGIADRRNAITVWNTEAPEGAPTWNRLNKSDKFKVIKAAKDFAEAKNTDEAKKVLLGKLKNIASAYAVAPKQPTTDKPDTAEAAAVKRGLSDLARNLSTAKSNAAKWDLLADNDNVKWHHLATGDQNRVVQFIKDYRVSEKTDDDLEALKKEIGAIANNYARAIEKWSSLNRDWNKLSDADKYDVVRLVWQIENDKQSDPTRGPSYLERRLHDIAKRYISPEVPSGASAPRVEVDNQQQSDTRVEAEAPAKSDGDNASGADVSERVSEQEERSGPAAEQRASEAEAAQRIAPDEFRLEPTSPREETAEQEETDVQEKTDYLKDPTNMKLFDQFGRASKEVFDGIRRQIAEIDKALETGLTTRGVHPADLRARKAELAKKLPRPPHRGEPARQHMRKLQSQIKELEQKLEAAEAEARDAEIGWRLHGARAEGEAGNAAKEFAEKQRAARKAVAEIQEQIANIQADPLYQAVTQLEKYRADVASGQTDTGLKVQDLLKRIKELREFVLNYGTKETKDAVQKQSPSKVDVRKQARDGKAVGERNAQPQKAARKGPAQAEEVKDTPEAAFALKTSENHTAISLTEILSKELSDVDKTAYDRIVVLNDPAHAKSLGVVSSNAKLDKRKSVYDPSTNTVYLIANNIPRDTSISDLLASVVEEHLDLDLNEVGKLVDLVTKLQPKRKADSSIFHTVESLTETLTKTFPSMGKAIKDGRVVILESQKDIDALKIFDRLGEGQVIGFYFPPTDTVYLVAGSITREASPYDALSLALHEIGEHAGMEAFLGEETYTKLLGEISTAMRGHNNTELGRAVKFIMDEVLEGTPKNYQYQPKEVLAHLIQRTPEAGFFKSLWADLRAWVLRKFGVMLKLDSDVLRALAKGATKRWLEHGGKPKDGPPMASFVPKQNPLPDIYAGVKGSIAVNDATQLWKTGKNWVKPLGDLVEDLTTTGLLPSAKKWYESYQKSLAERTRMEREAQDIAARALKLPKDSYARVNAFIAKSTFEQKWGYDATFATRSVKADPVMAKEFAKLNKEEQEIVKAVFEYGERMRVKREELFKKFGLNRVMAPYGKLEGPYAPLMRFGDWVVQFRSKELDAEERDYYNKVAADNNYAKSPAGKTQYEKIQSMKSDGAHYLVMHFDTKGQAQHFADHHRDIYGTPPSVFKQTLRNREAIGLDAKTLNMVLAATKAADIKDPQAKAAFTEVIQSMWIKTLDEQNARMHGLRRLNRAGFDPDMVRSFLAHAKADAGFMANIEYGSEINENFVALEREAETRRPDGYRATEEFNLIAMHYEDMLKAKHTPIQNAITGLTTFYMLTTSVGYHLQNLSQPMMVTVPRLAADFNDYTGAVSHLRKGYKMVREIVHLNRDGVSIRPEVNLNAVQSPGLRAMLEKAQDMRLLDVGLEENLNQLERFKTGYKWIDGSSALITDLFHRLYQVARAVELTNRVSAATAAYNMAIEHGRSDPTEYAIRVLQTTQGDFTHAGMPLVLKKLPKVIGQYRQFQIMMASLYGRAFQQAFFGATPEEKAVGKRMLGYMLFHASVASGVLGWPMMNVAAMVVAFMGDEDEPQDLERLLREHIGDKETADLLLRGPFYALGLGGLATKLGQQNTFAIAPFVDFEPTREGFLKAAGSLLTGPAGSQAGRMLEAVGFFQRGDYYRAIEHTTPKGIADAMAAWRYANRGYEDKFGNVIVNPEAFTPWLLTDAIGLPSAEVQRIKWTRSQQFEIRQFYVKKERAIRDALRNGQITKPEAIEEWKALQEGKRKVAWIFSDNLPSELKPRPVSSLFKSVRRADEEEQEVQEQFDKVLWEDANQFYENALTH